MKNTPKITRVQLQVKPNHDSVLIGIVSAEPDYKISLSLNRILNISLKHITPISLTDDDSRKALSFSRFSYHSKDTDYTIDLISNRCGNNFLLKKLINIDYIIHIQDPENYNNADKIIPILRNIEVINAVFLLDIETIRDKNLQYIIQ